MSTCLKVMWIHGIQKLPSHYILKRWCKNANTDVKRPINERSRDVGNSTALQMFRAKTIKSQFSHLIDLASKDIHSFNMADAKLRELVEHVNALQLDEDPGNEVVMDVDEGGAVQGITNIVSAREVVMDLDVEDEVQGNTTSRKLRDPPISKCKGRKKRPERWKIAAEKAPIKGRVCSYCGKMAKHNIRTCPKKKEDTQNGMIEEDEVDQEEDVEEEDE